MKLEERMTRIVAEWAGKVILRSDVAALGSASHVSKVLVRLQQMGVLIRIGTGIYVKTKVSSVTGATIPAGSLETLSVEALNRLGIELTTSYAASTYNAGLTTQVPGKLVFNTGIRRIQRRIVVGGRSVAYENDYSRTIKGA